MSAVYFRTDGNEQIATGHIMRCLSIARACRALHADAGFFVADKTSETVLRERFTMPDEFPIRCLSGNYQDLDAELPILQKILTERPADSTLLFIDSYFVTEAYLAKLQKICKTAYLDDLLSFDYPVDCIINYDIDTEPACYHRAAHRLLGAAYTPLREQFQETSYTVRPEVRNILISTGGTDVFNIAGKLLDYVIRKTPCLQDFHYHIITSRLNTHFQELERFAALHPRIHIHERVQDMAALMRRCDLAISAGGTTLYELCAVGVPSISFSVADNQKNAVDAFSSKSLIPYAGDGRINLETLISTVIAFLTENSSSYEKRQKSSHAMRAFIDGSGSARIAAALLSLINQQPT